MLAGGWCVQAAGPAQIAMVGSDLRVAKTCAWSKDDEADRLQEGGVMPDEDQHRDAPQATQCLRAGEGHRKVNPHPRSRLFVICTHLCKSVFKLVV